MAIQVRNSEFPFIKLVNKPSNVDKAFGSQPIHLCYNPLKQNALLHVNITLHTRFHMRNAVENVLRTFSQCFSCISTNRCSRHVRFETRQRTHTSKAKTCGLRRPLFSESQAYAHFKGVPHQFKATLVT